MVFFFKLLFFLILFPSCQEEKKTTELKGEFFYPIAVKIYKNSYLILNKGEEQSFISSISRKKLNLEKNYFVGFFPKSYSMDIKVDKLFIGSDEKLIIFDLLTNKKLKEIPFPNFVFLSLNVGKNFIIALVKNKKLNFREIIRIHNQNFSFKKPFQSLKASIESINYDEKYKIFYLSSRDLNPNIFAHLFRYQKQVDFFMPIFNKSKNNYFIGHIERLFLFEKYLFFYERELNIIQKVNIDLFRLEKNYFFKKNRRLNIGQFTFDPLYDRLVIPETQENKLLFLY